MFTSSSSVRCAAVGLPLLAAYWLPKLALAQPPDVVSTVKKPSANPVFRAAVVPDPPRITLEELLTLTGGPTLVTLSGIDLPVEDVTKALLQAARLPDSPFRGRNEKQKVTVYWKQTPFWEAAAQVEKQGDAIWNERFGSGISLVRFINGEKKGLQGTVAAKTPFVTLIANSITRSSRRTSLFGPGTARQQPDQLQMSLSAYFDPKFRVQATAFRALKFQMRGQNEAVAVENDRFGFDTLNFRGPNLISDLNISLPVDFPAETALARVNGILHCEMVSATQSFEVPDLLATETVTKFIGADQLIVQKATQENNQLTLQLRVTPGADANRGRARNFFANLHVRDGERRELLPGGFSSTSNRAEIGFSLRTMDGKVTAGPYSLEWILPTETRSFDVPFELRDVPIP